MHAASGSGQRCRSSVSHDAACLTLQTGCGERGAATPAGSVIVPLAVGQN